ncbi:MAG: hypothetical protein EOP59_11050 [Sphingomonadales bacterium]|nr:MAG: hypothetical protein EOP59_11050 [Sphingomonadales bacterium]
MIFAVLAIEAAWLVWRGRDAKAVALTLLPAVFILIGLRNALTGMAWPWIALPLALSFPVHLADLAARFGATRRRSDEL